MSETRLTMSHKEAKEKLNHQLSKAKEIADFHITTEDQYKHYDKMFERWMVYTEQLLQTMFTTDDFSYEIGSSQNYESFYDNGFGITLQSKVKELTNNIINVSHTIESIIERFELIKVDSSVMAIKENESSDNTKVFIVHGHDDAAKNEVARTIEKLGFEAVILHEQQNKGQTIIEKIEEHTNVGFGVVLYTPCDMGGKDSESLQSRARQNVVFEHGYLIGRLGREKVCALVKGNVETPSDISGVVYTPMVGTGWKFELANEMKAAGYAVDLNKL